MEMRPQFDRFVRRPTTSLGQLAAAIGLPAGILATVLLVSAVGANNAGLAMLTGLAVLATLLGGVIAAIAMIARGERSPLVIAVLVLALLPLAFVTIEILFPHE